MSKTIKPINILHYEDNETYAASFRMSATASRIIVDRVTNVDDFNVRLDANYRKYRFIVLDAKAYAHEDQKEGDESEINLHSIFKKLNELKSIGINIPHCINTGFSDLKLRYSDTTLDCEIFEKGQEEELMAYIWKTYNNSDMAILLSNFPDIFEFVNHHFSEANEKVIFGLFHNNKHKSKAIADRVANLSAMRVICEHLMDVVNSKYLVNSAVINSSSTRMRDIAQYLNDNGHIPVHIFSILTTIRRTASKYGSHVPSNPTEIDEYPSNYMISGIAESLNDVFSWAAKNIPA